MAGAGDGEADAAPDDAPDEERFPDVDESELDRVCLHNLLSACADNIYFKDRDSKFLRASRSTAAYTGVPDPARMIGRPASDYFTAEQAAATVEIEQMIMRTGSAVHDIEESRMRSPTGDEVYLSTSKQPLRDFDGRIIGTFGISRDITARKKAENEVVARTAELDRVGRELRMLIDSSPDPMSRFDRELRCSYANPAAAQLSGLSLDEILGHTVGEMGFSAQVTRDWDGALREVLETGAGVERELSLVVSGREIFLNTRFVPEVTEAGRVRSILTVSRDLTERRRIEQALAERAVRDPLTGLPNRTLLVSRIKQAIELDADRGRLALLFLDLDRFKLVNDGLGHAVGDELLAAVADRLRQAVRRGALVARFGGDEFVILCENLRDQAEAAVVAERVCQCLTPPFSCAGKQIHMTASIGIALSESASTADSLLRDADAAMYEAKASESSTGGYRYFAPAARKTVVRRVDLEQELRSAGEHEEFDLVYQPIVELGSGRITGAEALLRWGHPERGPLPPAEFLGIAEESGLIIPIGRWALETACEQLAEWDRAHPVGGDDQLIMAVNISPRQLSHDPDLVDAVAGALERNGLPSHRLCLEVTETAVHRASPLARTSLKALSAAGVKFALDDYGTGFSSLAHLRDIPVAALKIDRLFVNGLGRRGDDAIVVACITLAHALGMKVVAEGVETAQQRDRLLELGCDFGQGFLISPPLDPEAFSCLLEDPAGPRIEL